MLPIANPALDLLILQDLLHSLIRAFRPGHGAGLLLHFLAAAQILLPRHAGAENDVLAYTCRLEGGSFTVPFLQTEFCPTAPFGDAGVDDFADDSGADAARGLDFFAGIVEAVGHNGPGAVLVGGDLRTREDGGIIELFVVGPVGAAVEGLDE